MTSDSRDKRLKPGERELLERAGQILRSAVAEYVRVTSTMKDPEQAERAELAVAAAEDSLWRLRTRLLDWSRPSWAPNATLVADWFSEEDRVYDDIDLGRASW